jgi:hypothetical protein
MPEFTIAALLGSEDWGDGGEYGPKTTYRLALEGPQGRTSECACVELAQKRETAPPTIGQTLTGQLENKGGRWKFKKDKPAFNGNAGRAPMSPEKEAEITRMHSQEMAIRWAAILQASGQWPTDASPEQRKATLVSLIDFFQTDAASTKGAS